jgi:cellulose synthase/poly-beta-1,6-N-acetylglucosamine synthase-like glycosyltransferase
MRESRRAGGVASDVSVVVATYDVARWAELGECLEALAAQRLPPREVIVVVDHNAELLEMVRGSFDWVDAVESAGRRGLAGARNSGSSAATGAIIAFIDDDAAPAEDWLEHLLEGFRDEDVVGVGGALVPRWPGRPPAWMPREFYWVIGCSYTGLPDALAEVRNPIGANMAVRADVLRSVGGFREGDDHDQPRALRSRGVVRAAGNIPDDTDLAIRVSRARPRATWLYQPAAVVHHHVTDERTTFGYFLRRSFEEGGGKAHLARRVGADAGLASERRHAASVIPRGVARELSSLLRGDPAAGLRAAAIVAGLAATVAGFAVAMLGQVLRPRAAGG